MDEEDSPAKVAAVKARVLRACMVRLMLFLVYGCWNIGGLARWCMQS